MMAPRLFVFFLLMAVVFVFVLDQNGHFCLGMSVQEKLSLKNKVLEMFQHAYGAYMANAYPADELMPLSCRGRWRGSEPSRGDVDDSLGNFTLTLVDTLDTLAIIGDIPEFERAAKLIISNTKFDADIIVSVFETNIRVLGGLLGGHVLAAYLKKKRFAMEWYKDELLAMAKEVGTRLLPAFNTTTGIPYPRINLKHGIDPKIRTYTDTCTACAGTMILEFAALSRLTGDPVFEDKAHKAMDYLWNQRHRASDLVGTVINIHNGDWIRRESGVGAGIDSYYEYVLKAYILLGDDTYLTRFNKHYEAIMKYVSQGPLFVDVHMHRPLTTSRHFMDALQAFWPGLQVLKGDIQPAIEMHEMLYQVIQRHKFLPEAFTSDFRVHWGQHPLRPEFVESTYFLYKATGDHHYLDVGRKVIENLDRHARVRCGFAAIKDVTKGTHEDQMDSYVLAETFKYLFLLYAEKSDLVLDVDDYVFTTEAHLLPLSLSLSNYTRQPKKLHPEMYSHLREIDDEDEPVIGDGDHNTCTNPSHKFRQSMNYAQNLRAGLKGLVSQTQPQPPQTDTSCPVASSQSRLRAEDFVVGNKVQLQQLRNMGIELITMKDGRIQLLHTATGALSPGLAEEGLKFMQDMIALSKSEPKAAQHDPMIIKLIGPPFNGNIVYSAGPAQFGLDLKVIDGVSGEIQPAEPFKACTPVTNAPSLRGRIAILERGDCMFVDKARHIQAVGAIGGIVIDHNRGTSGQNQPLFAMSGDGKDNVNIPMLFLFNEEGMSLLAAWTKNPGLLVQMAAREAVYEEQTEAIVKATGPVVFESSQSGQQPVPPDIAASQSEQEGQSGGVSEQTKPYIKRVLQLNPLAPMEGYRSGEPKSTLGNNKDHGAEYTMSAGTDQVQVKVKINPIRSYPKSPEVRSDDAIIIEEEHDGTKLWSFRFDHVQNQPDLPEIYEVITKTLLGRTNFAQLRKQAEYLSAIVRLLEGAYFSKPLDAHTQELINELGNELEVTPLDELYDYESEFIEEHNENERYSEHSESVVYKSDIPSGEYFQETHTITADGVTLKVHTKMVKPSSNYHTVDSSYADEEDLTEEHIYIDKINLKDDLSLEAESIGEDMYRDDDHEHDISGWVPDYKRHKHTSRDKSNRVDKSSSSEDFIDIGDGINIEVDSSGIDIDSSLFDNINEELTEGLKQVLKQVSSTEIGVKNIKFVQVKTKRNNGQSTSSNNKNTNFDSDNLYERDSEQNIFQPPVDVEESADLDVVEVKAGKDKQEEVSATSGDNAQHEARRKRAPGDL